MRISIIRKIYILHQVLSDVHLAWYEREELGLGYYCTLGLN